MHGVPAARTAERADALFQAGRLTDARSLYEQAVHEGLSSDIVFFRLAHLSNREGQIRRSIGWLEKAIALNPQKAEYHYTLGRLYRAEGAHDLAERCYREAVRLREDYTDARISLGILLRNLGRTAEAEACHREALRIDPDNHLAVLNLGNTLISQDRFNEASDLLQLSQDRFDEAARCFRRALESNPQSAEAHQNLGRALLRTNEAEATHHFRQALAIDPNYFEAAESLGKSQFHAGAFDDAVAAFETANRVRPGVQEIRIQLAGACRAARLFDKAIAIYEQLLREQPDLARAKGGLAATLADRGQYTKPRALFEQAIAEHADDSMIQLNYAFFLLRSGDFANAWRHYEARWHSVGRNNLAIERSLPFPRWQGEALAGKSLLMTCEQALGDEIMFVSVVPEVLRDVAHCTIECDRRLETLFRRSFPGATVFGIDRKQKHWNRVLEQNLHALEPFDYWSPSGTVVGERRKAPEQFPKHAGYLKADTSRVQHWKARLNELGPGLKVGISWRGGTPLTRRAVRSMSLENLDRLFATSGVHFVNLQYGDCREELDEFKAATGRTIHHWQEAHDDYDETAALVCSLDLVISVCTSIVHLTGALGRPVWIMAPKVAEWRYGRDGTSMIWYPSAHVFRQEKEDNWSPVISDVKRALQKLLRERGEPVATDAESRPRAPIADSSPTEASSPITTASPATQRAVAVPNTVEALHAAIAAEPTDSEYHYRLGRLLKAQKDLVGAERCYREALRLRPDYFDVWISLGILLRNLTRFDEAEACQREALRLQPENCLATLNLGNVLLSREQFSEAAECLTRAVAMNPGSAEAHYNLGRAAECLHDAQAGRHFLEALRLNPNYFEAAERLGTNLFEAGMYERAIAAFTHAIRIRPDSRDVRLDLADSYLAARMLPQAAAEYERVLRDRPEFPGALGGLAAVHAARGQREQARGMFRRALANDAASGWLRFNYALLLLGSGEFAEAWDYYEARRSGVVSSESFERSFTQPLWQGEALADRNLLITCEQGLGDEIMFASVFGEAIRQADHCIIECDRRLQSLFSRSFPTATIFGVDRAATGWNRALEQNLHRLPDFDYWTPAGSLPRHRRTSSGAFPQRQGYLLADANRVAFWQERLQSIGPGLKVGISWRGGTVFSNTQARSITLDALLPLISTTGVDFVSLQYGECRAEIEAFTAATGKPIHHWQEAIDDYDETAALVSSLDLVVSVCTAVVHLSGALGQPVWVMAPAVPEWRYGFEGSSMIWYPSARIFRQTGQGSWPPVIAQVQQELSVMAAAHT